jgi:pimeloyl-ACP methyl ester carboxylesterase
METPTILLIPGLLGDQTVWQPLQAALSYESHVPDVYSKDDIRQIAADCLSAYDGDLHIAGHSLGGRIAFEIAHQAPDRVKRMALLDSGMNPLAEGERDMRDMVVQMAYDKGMEVLADVWLPGMVYRDTPELMQKLRDMITNKTPEQHEQQIKSLLSRPDAASYIADIACPVLLMTGEFDKWSPVHQQEAMLSLLQNGRLSVVPDVGHFSLLEDADTVSAQLVNFLQN